MFQLRRLSQSLRRRILNNYKAMPLKPLVGASLQDYTNLNHWWERLSSQCPI